MKRTRAHPSHPLPPGLPPKTTRERLFRAVTPWAVHDGVAVSAILAPEDVTDLALARVFAALDVLRTVAPAQAARVPRFMQGIVIRRLHESRGAWNADFRVCYLDLSYVLDPHVTHAELASTLVHELTHARLHHAGIPYGTATRMRVERLCFLASRNFEARLVDPIERERLLAQTARFLAMDPTYWSDPAVQARAREESAIQPWPIRLGRALGRVIGWWTRTRAI